MSTLSEIRRAPRARDLAGDGDRGVAVPTLLFYGAADVRAPRSVAEALHAAIPDSQLILLPDVGHDTNLEAPDAFNAEVRRFLRTVT